MDWFLYDNSLRHERVKSKTRPIYLNEICEKHGQYVSKVRLDFKKQTFHEWW